MVSERSWKELGLADEAVSLTSCCVCMTTAIEYPTSAHSIPQSLCIETVLTRTSKRLFRNIRPLAGSVDVEVPDPLQVRAYWRALELCLVSNSAKSLLHDPFSFFIDGQPRRLVESGRDTLGSAKFRLSFLFPLLVPVSSQRQIFEAERRGDEETGEDPPILRSS